VDGYTWVGTTLHRFPDNATGWFGDGWIIHGQTHLYPPFVDNGKKRINVSIEVINCSPSRWKRFINYSGECQPQISSPGFLIGI
jgi:hypothetical protein